MRLVPVLILLILAPVAFAPIVTCGDGVLGSGEECDDNNLQDGDGCSATCQLENYPVELAQLKLLQGHNLLFSKVLNLEHITKDNVFQLEFKEIEVGLIEAYDRSFCENLPPSFSLPANDYVYGKLDEVDQLIIFIQNALASANGVSQERQNDSAAFLFEAETALNASQFQLAAQLKCCAYNALRLNRLRGPICGDVPRIPRQFGGSGGGSASCVMHTQNCCYREGYWMNKEYGIIQLDDDFCQKNGYGHCNPNSVCDPAPHPELQQPTLAEPRIIETAETVEPVEVERVELQQEACKTNRDCSLGFVCRNGDCVKYKPEPQTAVKGLPPEPMDMKLLVNVGLIVFTVIVGLLIALLFIRRPPRKKQSMEDFSKDIDELLKEVKYKKD